MPDQSRRALGAIRHGVAGATVAWTLPVDGAVVTNLAAVASDDQIVAVGVGRADGVLRVWQRSD